MLMCSFTAYKRTKFYPHILTYMSNIFRKLLRYCQFSSDKDIDSHYFYVFFFIAIVIVDDLSVRMSVIALRSNGSLFNVYDLVQIKVERSLLRRCKILCF